MCKVEHGHDYSKDAAKEMGDDPMKDTPPNGRAWDAFWKVLSLLVIPWATAMTWLVWSLTAQMAAMSTNIELSHEMFERRLKLIETQMDPAKRFYRWDGEVLDQRIIELESLHPRGRQ